ncbi:CPBP family intramembrane metalloprotease [Candidatus Venteria ishoeyi]|uniref:CPBP family intramembrane glutamic endopeptidase n=1 Tax=Candidatus Venteria ishoeyi TaxID=1899563 RepID=UPI0025A5F7DF|nr:CPBP family intramembrane glutamic endopeptidase [Candidatus Venteria ishoeyi]MDM8547886.1 CPBP family intramembrane metalloprotease [Candidatus Venteria ishoeyi]
MIKQPSSTRILWAVLPAMLLPLVGALFYFVWFNAGQEMRLLYGVTKVLILLYPLLAFYWILQQDLPRLSWFDKPYRLALLSGLFSGLLISLLIIALMQTPLGEMVRGQSAVIREKVIQMGVMEHYILFAVAFSLLHSLLEEYYWRWFVFGRLSLLLPSVWAHVLAGISFAAHHIVIATQFFPWFWGWLLGVTVALGGIIWSLLYQRYANLLASWVSHILVDLTLFWVGYSLLFN